jgi:hypothetical protein
MIGPDALPARHALLGNNPKRRIPAGWRIVRTESMIDQYAIAT